MMRVATIPVDKTIPEEPDEEVNKAVTDLLTTSGIEAETGPWHPLGMALPPDVPTVLDVVSLVAEVMGIAGAVAAGGGTLSLDPPTQVRADGRYPGSALSRFLA